uniref:Kinesin motor domain-containing protein n=1 Tax=Mus spicilegus TaxID=10103 RepID=A0A8C6IHP2_MUSSI
MGDSKVKVAVRVRPMNRREIDLHTKCVVDVEANKVILNPVNRNLSKGDARFIKKTAMGETEHAPVLENQYSAVVKMD